MPSIDGMAVRRAQHDAVQLPGHIDIVDIAPLPGQKPAIFEAAQRPPDVAFGHAAGCRASAALGAPVREVQGQQALGKVAIGRRLVMRRVVGADAGRDGSTTTSWFGPRKNGIA